VDDGSSGVGEGSGEGITAFEVYNEQVGWNRALEKSGLGPVTGAIKALLWLIFFHWGQALTYYAAYYTYYPELGWGQQVFGGIIALREAAYLLGSCVAACVRPAFLLISLPETRFKDNGEVTAFLYIVSPEKTILYTLVRDLDQRKLGTYALIAIDLAAVGALISALPPGPAPLPLLLGYSLSVAALGATVYMLCDRNLTYSATRLRLI